MKVFWRNDALCLRPESDIERQALAAIALHGSTEPSCSDGLTGQESGFEIGGVEHGPKPCPTPTFNH
jgi:hypothetical protein